MTAVTTEEADYQLVSDALEKLLRDFPPATTSRGNFLSAQFDAGLAWVHFPKGKGGLGVSRALQPEVDERLAAAGAPHGRNTNPLGYSMGAPVVLAWGTEEQQHRYLRPLFLGEELWCQLFSEPGSGSDLAAAACRAVRDGDHWIINGQKVWNSMAQISDLGMLLARTDPDVPKHAGLSYFVLDMHLPGVEVRPLRQMTGDAEFNEVYLTDVRIPDSVRLGDVGAGWKVGMSTLMNERVMFGGRAMSSGPVDLAVELYKQVKPADPELRTRLVKLWIKARAEALSNVRAAENIAKGVPGPEGSIGKIGFAETNQEGYNLCLDILGDESMLYDTYEMTQLTAAERRQAPVDPRRAFLRARANSIEGGTSEIMRNILAERVLGLPPDFRVDKDKPWSQVPRS
ncbi:MAG TPA: acyl-CoA dehydrogenase family protein [Trebonia sp.]|nr:acyl-CoA dehydrogenase family protein [Trebonia sp.]